MSFFISTYTLVLLLSLSPAASFTLSRRATMGGLATVVGSLVTTNNSNVPPAHAEGQLAHKVDVDKFLQTGMSSNSFKGISGQGGKSRPETGVVLREGSQVDRDERTGDVSAELLLLKNSNESLGNHQRIPVLASFTSEQWPLAKGLFYDVECRDSQTGDAVFLAVTPEITQQGQETSIDKLKDSFIIDSLFGPTGRFSAYGEPTDIFVHSSETVGNRRIMDVSFATLSQSTQTEIPRHAQLYATIPEGTRQAVLLVGSSSARRWKKNGTEQLVAAVGRSFQAIAAPPTFLKTRGQLRKTLDVVV